MVGLHQSPLILCLLFQDTRIALEIVNTRDFQPTNFPEFIKDDPNSNSFRVTYLDLKLPKSCMIAACMLLSTCIQKSY